MRGLVDLVWLRRWSGVVCFAGSILAANSLLAQDRPELEHPQALNATAYTAIAPTFNDSAGNISFVRLYNLDTAASSTFSITVMGSPSAQQYGNVVSISVPANASFQYSIGAILNMAGAGSLSGGDDSYTLYMRNPNVSAAYQHVVFNNASRFFENLTNCVFFQGAVYRGIPQVLPNIHTSVLASGEFPSRIFVHNQSNQTVTYKASVFDAATGGLLGKVDLQMGPNVSTVFPETYFEQQLNWTPTASQVHINMTFEQVGAVPGSFTFDGTVAHIVFNARLNASVNMSSVCRVQRP